VRSQNALTTDGTERQFLRQTVVFYTPAAAEMVTSGFESRQDAAWQRTTTILTPNLCGALPTA
jgi:hypothetical protein